MGDLQQEQCYREAICRIGRRIGEDFKPEGAGFLVSDRHIFTCAHVVNAVLSNGPKIQSQPTDIIHVEFCEKFSGQWRQARVVYWLPVDNSQQKEDIAVLELLQPLPKGASLKLSAIAPQSGNHCKAYGFSKNHENGVWSYGIIQDALLGPSGWVQITKKTSEGQESYAIEKGFSGTLLWDVNQECAAGMVVAAERRQSEEDTAFVIPAPILLEVLRSLQLLQLLEPHWDAIAPNLKAAYHFCQPELLREPYDSSTLQSLLETLEAIERNTPDSLWKFVAYLVEDTKLQVSSLKVDLAAWATEICSEFKQFRQDVQDTLTIQPVDNPDCQTKSAVLVVLEPVAQKADHFRPRVIAIPNCAEYDPKTGVGAFNLLVDVVVEDCSLENLPELLSPCLEMASCQFSVDPTVEIFLPLNDLNTVVDTWEMGDELFGETDRLGNKHCVVLRSYERTLRPAKLGWKTRWDNSGKAGESAALQHFLLCNGKNLDALKVDLTNNKVLGLGLTQSPKAMKGGPLTYVLSNGVPMALWIRQDLSHCNCADQFKTLLACALKDLPQVVRQQWQAAYRSGVDHKAPLEHTQLGHHLALLWDNPKLPPPDPTKKLLQMS